MEFRTQQLFIFLSLAFVASHAALPSEIYWKTMLPNTPMPKAIKEILPSEDLKDDKSGSVGVGVGGGGVNVGVGSGHPGGVNVGVGKGGGVGVGVGGGHPAGGTNVDVRHGGGSVSVRSHHHGKPVYVGVNPGPQPFSYNYAATDDQLHDNPNVALFFLEKDLSQGKKMSLHFFKSSNGATFLPREVAESIPFSSNKMSDIFSRFSVKSNSVEAETMKKTIKECEEPGIRGEEKSCATSLESMVDFSTSKLGKNILAISTNTEKETQQQEYSIMGVKKMAGDNAVVCHKQNYAYAVFYCHKTHTTRAYTVSLVGLDGTKAKAVAVCHEDTSAWNPNHLAFKVLKVKPGNVPVCHFLPEDHIVWVPQ